MTTWLLINAGLLLAAYLLGSLPTGYLAGKLLKGIDLRTEGSGSTGATNVLRTLGKGPAIVVLLVDILKAVAAIALVRVVYAAPSVLAIAPATVTPEIWKPWVIMLAGIMVLIGHSKSVWLGFQGGKSVASGLGVFLAIAPVVGLLSLAVFSVVLAVFRIVSLGSIMAAIAGTILMVAFQKPIPYQLIALLGGVYVILRHRQNIQRLLAGTEPKIGQKLEQASSPSQK
ncbi:MAG: glycerol-3-phosphate 1-O-acyltransferase PlsY [Synechococcales cyanobacterium T60_A2020_003]|nr:glycerol-3-phosphate 1-O-acyltransferase PlsY [Synechococcales cyanobacterium T60_A2020_003]